MERVAEILLTFAESADPLGVSEVARRVGLAKSLVFRVLTSLVQAGFLQKAPDARYWFGPRALQVGLAALRSRDVVGASMPHMQRLCECTQETITLSLRVGNERTYAAQVVSQQDVHKSVRTGERYPLYAGNSGRAILAWFTLDEFKAYLASVPLERLTPITICDATELRRNLAEVRERGYAVSYGERDPWSAGIGAPIFDISARVLGAISVCAPIGRLPIGDTDRIGRLVQETAAAVSVELGYSGVDVLWSPADTCSVFIEHRELSTQLQMEEVRG